MRFLFTYCFLILFLGSAMGQGKYNLPVTVQGKDTLPMYVMGDINLGPQPQPNSNADQIAQLEKEQSWRRLVANVRLLMPYAMDCAKRLKDIDTTMPQLDRRRDRHEYLKEQEAKVMKDYKAKLEDLSPNQGDLLIKLIYRQTGRTSYSLIKDYKSGFSAFLWQNFAKFYGTNLKKEYDPKEDQFIELAIHYVGYN